MQELKGRHLRGITDFTEEEIEFTLEVSKQLKRDLKMGRAHRLLEGKSLGGIFETPSTRTSVSFETAMMQLGGHMLWRRLRETQKVLQKRGVGFAMLENENLCTDLVAQYLSLKRRQVL